MAVEVTLVGLSAHNTTNGQDSPIFHGLYRIQDVRTRIAELEVEAHAHISPDIGCWQTPMDGDWVHDRVCPYDEPGRECPYEVRHEASRDLARLKRRRILKPLFEHPDLANNGTNMDNNEPSFTESDILRWSSQSYPTRLEEILFPGLLVQEDWLVAQPKTTLPLMAITALVISVVLAWVAYRDWAVAWQVGGCFLALGALVCTWTYQVVD
ncbi:hypothetical protein PG993_008940 [Apiospora rasikravindrae]|uniref:Uncharacterized protein n=1 Tax=Apiospora rasikravindrae TaxID=990691 RepID=A0ABR1SPR0_9PEZI